MSIESGDSEQAPGADGGSSFLLDPRDYDVSGLGGASGEILRAAFARIEAQGDDVYAQYGGALPAPDDIDHDRYQDTGIVQPGLDELPDEQ